MVTLLAIFIGSAIGCLLGDEIKRLCEELKKW